MGNTAPRDSNRGQSLTRTRTSIFLLPVTRSDAGICEFLSLQCTVQPLPIHFSEPERIRHRICMDDLCCAFREMTNRLRSTLSKAKEQSNWLCLLQFYRNGILAQQYP